MLLISLEGKKSPLLISVAAILVFRLAVNLPLQEGIVISGFVTEITIGHEYKNSATQ